MVIHPAILDSEAAPLPPPPLAFQVVFATPLNSNTIRVFLTKEPRHSSPLGPADALNRLNWDISLIAGPGKVPIVTKVENPLPQPDLEDDALGPLPTAWSVDLRTNQRILLESTYLTVASPDIETQDGLETMAAPPDDRGEHPGIKEPRQLVPFRAVTTQLGIDLFYDFFGDRSAEGAYNLDPRNDLDVHSGLSALKKRIIRRLITRPGGFFHLPSYGAGLKTKELFNSTQLAVLRTQIERQVREEEEVSDLSAVVTSPAPGVLIVELKIRTAKGFATSMRIEVPDEGDILIS